MGRVLTRNYLEHRGRKFHERAEPDAYALALRMAADIPRGRLLDLAAGAGYTSVQLAELGFDVTAYDIHTEQFVPEELPCIRADLNQPLPEADGSVAAVMALEVIEHLESPKAFLRDIGRVLQPGGALVLSTPNIVSISSKFRFATRNELQLFFADPSRVRDPFCHDATGHISPVLPWLLAIFLDDAGFRIDSTSYTAKWGIRSRHLGRSMILRATKQASA